MALNGHADRRLPNTLNVSFVGQVGVEALGRLDGVAAVRFSLGRGTTQAEIDNVLEQLRRAAYLPSNNTN